MSIEIIAQINFLNSKLGGRNTPFGQGLSPRVIFSTSKTEYLSEFKIEKSKTIFPGDQVKLVLKIKGQPGILIYEGVSFDLFEGEKIIGNGVIMGIL